MKTRIKTPFPPGPDESISREIRVFLADDQPLLTVLLARLLAKDPRITIVGSAPDGLKAFHSAASLHPDLVLTDLHMPLMDGVELTRRLKQLPNPPVVFVVTSDDTPEALTRSLEAGADAFLVKAVDLSAQLQTAMEDFFPPYRKQEKQAQTQSHELAIATN